MNVHNNKSQKHAKVIDRRMVKRTASQYYGNLKRSGALQHVWFTFQPLLCYVLSNKKDFSHKMLFNYTCCQHSLNCSSIYTVEVICWPWTGIQIDLLQVSCSSAYYEFQCIEFHILAKFGQFWILKTFKYFNISSVYVLIIL